MTRRWFLTAVLAGGLLCGLFTEQVVSQPIKGWVIGVGCYDQNGNVLSPVQVKIRVHVFMADGTVQPFTSDWFTDDGNGFIVEDLPQGVGMLELEDAEVVAANTGFGHNQATVVSGGTDNTPTFPKNPFAGVPLSDVYISTP